MSGYQKSAATRRILAVFNTRPWRSFCSGSCPGTSFLTLLHRKSFCSQEYSDAAAPQFLLPRMSARSFWANDRRFWIYKYRQLSFIWPSLQVSVCLSDIVSNRFGTLSKSSCCCLFVGNFHSNDSNGSGSCIEAETRQLCFEQWLRSQTTIAHCSQQWASPQLRQQWMPQRQSEQGPHTLVGCERNLTLKELEPPKTLVTQQAIRTCMEVRQLQTSQLNMRCYKVSAYKSGSTKMIVTPHTAQPRDHLFPMPLFGNPSKGSLRKRLSMLPLTQHSALARIWSPMVTWFLQTLLPNGYLRFRAYKAHGETYSHLNSVETYSRLSWIEWPRPIHWGLQPKRATSNTFGLAASHSWITQHGPHCNCSFWNYAANTSKCKYVHPT